MNEIQAHIVQLLKELDEICTTNQIPYILYGRTAKDACVSGTFCGEYLSAAVLIPGQYFPVLERLIQKQFSGRRSVEWVGNNPQFPGMHMRYVDEETTFIYGDSAHRYYHKGIYVSIERARYIPKKKGMAQLANWIDKVIEYAGVEDITTLTPSKQRAVRLIRMGMRCWGHERVVRALLCFQCRIAATPSKQMALIRYLKDNLNFSADYFKTIKRVSFAECSFFVPQKHGDYLNLVFGKDWKSISPRGVPSPHLLVTSTTVSYRDLGVETDQKIQKAVTQTIQKRHFIAEQMKTLKREIERCWDVLFMTQRRYELYREYYPRKGELLIALERREYDLLQLVMRKALEAEKKYLDMGSVLSLDAEIDQIIIRILLHQGKYDLARKMEERLSQSVQVKPEIGIISEEDSAVENDAFWPKQICADVNGNVAVYCRGASGEEIPVMWRVGKNLYELLHKKESRLVPSVNQGDLVALDGNHLLSIQELFTDKLGGAAYIILMQKDFLNREFAVAALTQAGAIYPMVTLDSNRLISSIELPRICQVNPDLSVSTQICVYGELLGEAFWRNPNGYVTPALAVGVRGRICSAPHYPGAELVWQDQTGALLPVEEIWDDSDPVKVQIAQEEGQPFCTLVQQDVFGRTVVMAEALNSRSLKPCGRIDKTGLFQEDYSAAQEYALYVETVQQELLPLSQVQANGEGISTVYTAFLQEISGSNIEIACQ